jgi:hypothetical protein
MRSSWRHSICGSALLLALAMPVTVRAQAAPARSPLVGTWRIIRFEDHTAPGDTVRLFGERPLGYLVYTATGQVLVQITSSPVQRMDSLVVSPNDYAAYFGRYTVDERRGVMAREGS